MISPSPIPSTVSAPDSEISRIPPEQIAATLAAAFQEGVFTEDDDTVLFYDTDRLRARIADLQSAFPVSTLHAIAVKANPTIALLKLAASLGIGAEIASSGELAIVDAAGLNPRTLVFDSPAKTEREIRHATQLPLLLNANSSAELHRIADIGPTRARIGLRINPLVGMGTIDHTSTATFGSKFGVPIDIARAVVQDYVSRGGRLDALHVHVGSQGMSIQQLVSACGSVYALFCELREPLPELSMLDIGGGLSVSYGNEATAHTFGEYAQALRTSIPGLWSPDITLATEFGRSLHANNGWVASRIEYVLRDQNRNGTLVTHVGADLFVRAAYRPDVWSHEVFVLAPDGRLRTGENVLFSVAGPLCFSGDYIARNASIPSDVAPGDFLIVRDTGAYTSSMWSIYNSRQMPKSVGYSAESGFHTLTHRETLSSVVSRWSA